MTAIKRTLLSIGIISLLFVFFTVFHYFGNNPGLAAVFSSQQKLIYAECISTFSNQPLTAFEITPAYINEDDIEDAIVRATSADQCGTGGCIYELCISHAGSHQYVPLSIAAKKLEVSMTVTKGMKDLILNSDKQLTMSWNGSSYKLNP